MADGAADELLGQLRTVEVELDAAAAVRQEAATGDGGRVQQDVLVLLDGGQHPTTEFADARMQAYLTVLLPVLAATFAGAVDVVAVVAHLERAFRLRGFGGFSAFRVFALDDQFLGGWGGGSVSGDEGGRVAEPDVVRDATLIQGVFVRLPEQFGAFAATTFYFGSAFVKAAERNAMEVLDWRIRASCPCNIGMRNNGN